MKKLLICIAMAITALSCKAQAQDVIKLDAPDLSRGKSVMTAFSERQSIREYSTKEFSAADLSDLLWAANGINRPETGMRTAASCLNKQDVDIYVFMKSGAYLYDAKNSALSLVAAGDNRDAVVAGQMFAADAPVMLVLVSDLSLFSGINDAGSNQMGAIDVGIVSGNISMFCAGAGLATVPRATMDKDKIRTILKLKADQLPILNHPVGYIK